MCCVQGEVPFFLVEFFNQLQRAVIPVGLDIVSWQVGGERLIEWMLIGRPGIPLVLADAILFAFELCMSVQVCPPI